VQPCCNTLQWSWAQSMWFPAVVVLVDVRPHGCSLWVSRAHIPELPCSKVTAQLESTCLHCTCASRQKHWIAMPRPAQQHCCQESLSTWTPAWVKMI
jgi:hypothetical protein